MVGIKIAIISDIHGNYEAFKAIIDRISNIMLDGTVFLGDAIDYGPHSNEIIESIKMWQLPIYCNIWGNHENAVMKMDYSHFSSERGQISAQYTADQLSPATREYIQNEMCSTGMYEFQLCGKSCLAVHGSLNDYLWKSIFPDGKLEEYMSYDYVFSGHSHEPHCFEKYYKVDNPDTRNRKKTIFINPGSVGQPRNINNMAQFAVVDLETEEVSFIKVPYDIDKEMEAFSDNIDSFYKDRIKKGI